MATGEEILLEKDSYGVSKVEDNLFSKPRTDFSFNLTEYQKVRKVALYLEICLLN